MVANPCSIEITLSARQPALCLRQEFDSAIKMWSSYAGLKCSSRHDSFPLDHCGLLPAIAGKDRLLKSVPRSRSKEQKGKWGAAKSPVALLLVFRHLHARRHKPDFSLIGIFFRARLYARGLNTLLHQVGLKILGASRGHALACRGGQLAHADDDRMCLRIALQPLRYFIHAGLR